MFIRFYERIQASTTKYERLFIVLTLLCSYFINFEASITKAISNSLFIHAYTYEYLPYVWLALVPLNFLVVNFYNKFIPKIGIFYMLVCCTLITVVLNIFTAFYLTSFKWLPFVLYLWKDLYILMLFQQLWSLLAATLNSSQAKILYGLLWGVGGVGAMSGSFFPGFLATKLGSEKLLLITLPIYAMLLFCYFLSIRVRDKYIVSGPIQFDQTKPSSFVEGAKLIKKSKALLFIFLITIFMQVASTLIDFQFNQSLSLSILDKDLRTEYLGRFFGIVNGLNVILQFLGSYLIMHFVGVKGTHFVIPLYLGGLICSYLIHPAFSVLAWSYGSIKALDYSIFGIVKEILYIPMNVEEKFLGKAVIDVFVYRTSKAVASCCIIGLGFFTSLKLSTLITQVLLFIFILWCLTVVLLLDSKKPVESTASSGA